MTLLIIGFIIILLYGAYNRWLAKMKESEKSTFIHAIHGNEFSAQELFEAIEEKINSLEFPDITMSRQNRKDGGLMSTTTREHLIIRTTDNFGYLIYAAPVVNWYFISVRYFGQSKKDWNNHKRDIRIGSRSFYPKDAKYVTEQVIRKAIFEVIDQFLVYYGEQRLTLEQKAVFELA